MNKKYRSETVSNNGFNPVFPKDLEIKFKIRGIDFAFIIIKIKTELFGKSVLG